MIKLKKSIKNDKKKWPKSTYDPLGRLHRKKIKTNYKTYFFLINMMLKDKIEKKNPIKKRIH